MIATTTLGAEVGYTALWVILLSCFIKPIVQAEMARYVIASGETGLASFNHVPGPRLKVNWIVWAWAVMTLLTLLQVGAMFGGVAQVMNLIFPAVPITAWVLLFLAITLALLLGGGYARIERLAMVKVGFFTMLTFLAAVLLVRMPQYFSWPEFWDGFKFKMPGTGFSTAVAVFGITGVGASELFMYPYWCVEKGYARFAGRRDGSPEWNARAPWLDSGDAHGHRGFDVDLHRRDNCVLPARRRHSARDGQGADRERYDPDLVEHLYADLGRLVAVAVLPRRDCDALWNDLRRNGCQFARLCRYGPADGRV